MKKIPLTRGMEALVDDEDFDRLNQFKWYAMNAKGRQYAARHTRGVFPRGTVLMHREIAGTPDGSETDHINGNGLYNLKSNLRSCSRTENNRNKGCSKRSKSGIKGVHFKKNARTWIAQISVNSKRIHLGCFKCPLLAAIAYDEAALKYHRSFAYLNIISRH